MANGTELILLIENDPDISDLIARQALKPVGYNVKVVDDANKAISAAMKLSPDLVIADLNASGLSGRDLLVAFNAQHFKFPVIVLAAKEQEREVMQTMRLGAADYLLWPAQAPEIVAVVDQALKQIREEKNRQALDMRLKESDRELASQTRNLKTILSIGKAVISITDQRVLFNRIVEGALHISAADMGWFLIRDEKKKNLFLLAAHRNLPPAWAKKMNQPLDDGVSSLVSLSGEALTIHGEPLKRFKLSALGNAAAVIPIKVQNEVIALLVVVRQKNIPIRPDEQALLEAVADYASISLVNARLFRALQQSADASHSGDKRQAAILETLKGSLHEELRTATFSLNLLAEEKLGELNSGQKQALQTANAALGRLQNVVQKALPTK